MPPESFVDFLEAYGEANPPSMLYREGEDFAQWQRGFRQKLAELLGPRPERVEPTAEVVETIAAEDHTRHLLRIPVNRFSTLVAYLLVPHGLSEGEKRPGLLVSHGHARYGIEGLCGVRGMDEGDGERRAYALSAAQSGYVVLVPAWWGWAAATMSSVGMPIRGRGGSEASDNPLATPIPIRRPVNEPGPRETAIA